MLDCFKRHMVLVRDYGTIPKHHQWLHGLLRQSTLGNARLYWNFLDESLNKVLKGCCKHASQATFEPTVLSKMRVSLLESRKRKA